MKIIYILFFLSLNFLVFSYLTGKVKLSNTLRIIFFVFISIVAVLHFLNYIQLSTDKLFIILLAFSLAPFILNFAGKITVLLAIKTNSSIKEHFVLNIFNFMMNYVFYIMISIFQIATIIKN